jgi:transposase-like protein
MTRRKRYSAEFKREALRRAYEEGVTDVLVAEEMGLDARQLRRWREAQERDGDKAFPVLSWLSAPPPTRHAPQVPDLNALTGNCLRSQFYQCLLRQ